MQEEHEEMVMEGVMVAMLAVMENDLPEGNQLGCQSKYRFTFKTSIMNIFTALLFSWRSYSFRIFISTLVRKTQPVSIFTV